MFKLFHNHTAIHVNLIGCEKFDEVKSLSFSNFGLDFVDEDIYRKFPNINVLDLSYNKLETINLPTNPRITSLNCSYNSLKYVDFLHNFPGLKELDITGNPLPIVEFLIAACVCPNSIGIERHVIELAKKLDLSYEKVFWPKLLKIWNANFASKYSPQISDLEFALLRQEFEKKISESKLILQPQFTKFEEHKLSSIITRLMIKVRHSEALEEPINEFKAGFKFKVFFKKMKQIKTACESSTVNTIRQETPEKTLLNPVEMHKDEASTITSKEHNHETIAEAVLDIVGPKVRAKMESAPLPIKIRIKRNSNNSLDSELINEIYRSPRKLIIPLIRIDEVNVNSKTKNTPLLNDENKCTKTLKGVGRVPSTHDSNTICLSPIENGNSSALADTPKSAQITRLGSAGKRDSIRKDSQDHDTTSSSKEMVQLVKRKLNMENTGSDKSEPVSSHKLLRLTKDKMQTTCSNSPHKEITRTSHIFRNSSSDDNKMESLKETFQTFINESINLNEVNTFQKSLTARLPKLRDWKLHHLLRCHSPENLIDDSITKVWRCVFEPCIKQPGSTSLCVATCGGNTVCIIDCTTAKIKFRYKSHKIKEEFFALDWATIELKNYQPVHANILAVGSSLGWVHLLHPSQLTCYSKMKCCSSPISSLIFHPKEPHILYCGSYKGVIVVWDIGSLQYPHYDPKWNKLNTIEVKGDVLNIAFATNFNLLLAGCEKGCYGWNAKSSGKSLVKNKLKFIHPTSKSSECKFELVDSLVILSNNIIATKCAGHGCIYLWNLEVTLKSSGHSNVLDICVIATLEWSQTQNVFMNMGSSSDTGILACGDTEGRVWVYNIAKVLREKKLSSQTYSPSAILSMPEIAINIDDDVKKYEWNEIIVNAVTLSSDGKFLITAFDKNVVGIWV